MASESGFARIRAIYFVAIAIVVVIVLGWRQFWTAPGYLALLLVAVIARMWGFLAAVVATIGLAALLWFRILPAVFPDRPLPFLLVRLLLFLIVGIIIAQIVLQRDETEERYQRLVDLSPDGIGMIDQDGKVIYANPAMLRILGATAAEQVIGRNTVEFVHPHEQDRSKERIATLRRGEPLELPEREIGRAELGRVATADRGGAPDRHVVRKLIQ